MQACENCLTVTLEFTIPSPPGHVSPPPPPQHAQTHSHTQTSVEGMVFKQFSVG